MIFQTTIKKTTYTSWSLAALLIALLAFVPLPPLACLYISSTLVFIGTFHLFIKLEPDNIQILILIRNLIACALLIGAIFYSIGYVSPYYGFEGPEKVLPMIIGSVIIGFIAAQNYPRIFCRKEMEDHARKMAEERAKKQEQRQEKRAHILVEIGRILECSSLGYDILLKASSNMELSELEGLRNHLQKAHEDCLSHNKTANV